MDPFTPNDPFPFVLAFTPYNLLLPILSWQLRAATWRVLVRCLLTTQHPNRRAAYLAATSTLHLTLCTLPAAGTCRPLLHTSPAGFCCRGAHRTACHGTCRMSLGTLLGCRHCHGTCRMSLRTPLSGTCCCGLRRVKLLKQVRLRWGQ